MAEQNSNEITVDKKLSDIFDEGYNLLIELETTSLPFNSLEFQDKVRKCIKLFEDSTRLVSIIGMFSSNENIEEIATDHLKYLLLPFYLGQLSTKISKNDREEVLKVADIYYNDFLKRCVEYEICPSSSTSTNTAIQKTGVENDEIRNLIQMASNRNSKIEQYRQKKELEEQLKELKASVERDHVDDEIRREFYMKTLKVAIINAKEEIQSIKQELEILAFRNARSQNDEELPQSSSNTTHPHHHHHHQHRPKIEPLKPIIITRDLAQKAVFGMGYPSLPVMSVDEFYEQRVREGIFPNAEQVVEMNKKMFQRENSEEKEEQENAEKEVLVENDDPQYLERQRQMDEYKDFVRRGQGNRYNRS